MHWLSVYIRTEMCQFFLCNTRWCCSVLSVFIMCYCNMCLLDCERNGMRIAVHWIIWLNGVVMCSDNQLLSVCACDRSRVTDPCFRTVKFLNVFWHFVDTVCVLSLVAFIHIILLCSLCITLCSCCGLAVTHMTVR